MRRACPVPRAPLRSFDFRGAFPVPASGATREGGASPLPMVPEQIGETPSAYDWGSDRYYGRAHLRLRVLARLLSPRLTSGTRLLDVGAGPAILARLLDMRAGYVGLDQYDGALAAAGDFDLRHWVWDDRACEPLVSDGPYDFVVASGFLEYIDSREAFFRRAREALRPGGVLITSMISEEYRPRRRRARRGLPSRHARWKQIARPSELDGLFRAAGLVPQAATPVVHVWREWPGAAFSVRRRRSVSSFVDLALGPYTDQMIYEARRPE